MCVTIVLNDAIGVRAWGAVWARGDAAGRPAEHLLPAAILAGYGIVVGAIARRPHAVGAVASGLAEGAGADGAGGEMGAHCRVTKPMISFMCMSCIATTSMLVGSLLQMERTTSS